MRMKYEKSYELSESEKELFLEIVKTFIKLHVMVKPECYVAAITSAMVSVENAINFEESKDKYHKDATKVVINLLKSAISVME